MTRHDDNDNLLQDIGNHLAAVVGLLSRYQATHTSQPTDYWAGLLASAEDFPPERKVQLLKAMGFTPYGRTHDRNCVSLQGSGLICTCVQPEKKWRNPEDVTAFLGETYEERRLKTRERIRREDDEFDADRWDLHCPSPKPEEKSAPAPAPQGMSTGEFVNLVTSGPNWNRKEDWR